MLIPKQEPKTRTFFLSLKRPRVIGLSIFSFCILFIPRIPRHFIYSQNTQTFWILFRNKSSDAAAALHSFSLSKAYRLFVSEWKLISGRRTEGAPTHIRHDFAKPHFQIKNILLPCVSSTSSRRDGSKSGLKYFQYFKVHGLPWTTSAHGGSRNTRCRPHAPAPDAKMARLGPKERCDREFAC